MSLSCGTGLPATEKGGKARGERRRRVGLGQRATRERRQHAEGVSWTAGPNAGRLGRCGEEASAHCGSGPPGKGESGPGWKAGPQGWVGFPVFFFPFLFQTNSN